MTEKTYGVAEGYPFDMGGAEVLEALEGHPVLMQLVWRQFDEVCQNFEIAQAGGVDDCAYLAEFSYSPISKRGILWIEGGSGETFYSRLVLLDEMLCGLLNGSHLIYKVGGGMMNVGILFVDSLVPFGVVEMILMGGAEKISV